MKITTGIAIAAAVVTSTAANAEVDLAWTGLGEHQLVHWGYDDALNWDGSTIADQSYGKLGLYQFNDGQYEGYCWDLDAPVSESPVPYELLTAQDYSGQTLERFVFLASLYDQWYDVVKTSGDNEMGAALAFLTNEIMEENYSFDAGTYFLDDVKAQSSTMTGAVQFSDFNEDVQFHYDTMLASLDFGTAAMVDGLVIYQSVDGEFQDFVGYVPAPSALALLGVAGLAGRRRRNG